MREQNPSVYSDPNGSILKELYELKRLVIQQGQGQKEVMNVFISVNRLASMGVDPKMLGQLLQSQNQIINAGEIVADQQQLKVVADGTYTSIADISNQLIPTANGQSVRLGDFARIEKGYLNPPSTLMRVDGKPAIGIGISSDPMKDVVKTGDLVEAKLAEIESLIPAGIELVTLYPENVIAKEANNGFILNLVESLLIVIVIIMLVLVRIRDCVSVCRWRKVSVTDGTFR
jgi:multidrug efflux pump subunit AcrB